MFRNVYKNKKVFITGHTGFKGAWLTMWLLSMGAEVCGYSDGISTSPSVFNELGIAGRITHHQGDVRDLAELTLAIHDFLPDFVFHLAAQATVALSYDDPLATLTTNVIGTANLLESLRSIDYPCVAVVVTSDKCYEDAGWVWGYREADHLGGRDIYSGSKGAAEIAIHAYFRSFFSAPDCPIRIATARAGNAIGGGDWARGRIVADCMRNWSAGNDVEIDSPSATLPWQHVLEPLSGYLNLGLALFNDRKCSGESFNFGPLAEQNRTLTQLLTDLKGHLHIPSSDAAYRVTTNVPFHDAGLLRLNCDKALFRLNWEASLTYEQCVELVGKWYCAYYKGDVDMQALTLQQIQFYEAQAKQRALAWAA
ncbi:MAG: CDP-glucose 4,6-dehydratase [Janthinobacterium lividum]